MWPEARLPGGDGIRHRLTCSFAIYIYIFGVITIFVAHLLIGLFSFLLLSVIILYMF